MVTIPLDKNQNHPGLEMEGYGKLLCPQNEAACHRSAILISYSVSNLVSY